MNKTLSIGLAGFSFIIEEHAYVKLSDYLRALRNSLEKDEADEVMHDIEIRMVEIFKDNLGKREVINDADVERIITQIGKPEQIEEQEEAYFTNENKQKTKSINTQKQLFRDPENRKIAGVCAGLAYYTGLDVTLMRAIWLGIALLGIFTAAISTSLIIFLYIVLWIVLPNAKTASDFLKMKGMPVNFDTLKEESGKIVQFANESTQRVGEFYNESKPYINKAGNGIWNVIRYILGSIFAIMGIVFIIGALGIFSIYNTNGNVLENIKFYFQENHLGNMLVILAFLSAFIPAVLLLFLAIKLISPKTTLKHLKYVVGGLVLIWLACVVYCGANALPYAQRYKGHNQAVDNLAISTTSDSILLDVNKVTIPQNFKSYWDDIYSDGKTIYKEDYIRIDVKREDVKAPYIAIKKEADGYNFPLNMEIPVKVTGNKIELPNYFSYPYEDRFRDFRLNYELVLPKNIKVMNLNKDEIDLSENGVETSNKSNVEVNKKISINGTNIEINTKKSDSVKINGKWYPHSAAQDMLDSLDLELNELKNLKDINIKINNNKDKKEISISTK